MEFHYIPTFPFVSQQISTYPYLSPDISQDTWEYPKLSRSLGIWNILGCHLFSFFSLILGSYWQGYSAPCQLVMNCFRSSISESWHLGYPWMTHCFLDFFYFFTAVCLCGALRPPEGHPGISQTSWYPGISESDILFKAQIFWEYAGLSVQGCPSTCSGISRWQKMLGWWSTCPGIPQKYPGINKYPW